MASTLTSNLEATLLTTYMRLQILDSSERQRTRDDSKTSIEKTAPEIAPIPAPRKNPLSVAWPTKAPVMAPRRQPTENKYKMNITINSKWRYLSLSNCKCWLFSTPNSKQQKNRKCQFYSFIGRQKLWMINAEASSCMLNCRIKLNLTLNMQYSSQNLNLNRGGWRLQWWWFGVLGRVGVVGEYPYCSPTCSWHDDFQTQQQQQQQNNESPDEFHKNWCCVHLDARQTLVNGFSRL